MHTEKITIDERANLCFGCGPDNPYGLHLAFIVETKDDDTDPEAITATAPVQLDSFYEGPPGHIHGGIVATLLDEAMSKLNRPFNVLAMTRHMEIDYLRPAPLRQPLTLIGRHLRRDGRKLFHHAELQSQDGTVLARAKGLFIVLDPALIEAAKAKGLL
jgi:acyl-coenzyme A thioesterase PaaI-like protein